MCLRVPLGVQILFLDVSTDGKSPSNFPPSKQRVQHRHFQLHVLPQGQSQYLSHYTHISLLFYPNNAWLDSSLRDIHNPCFQSLSHTSFLKLSRALVTGHLATREFCHQPTRHQETISPPTISPPSKVYSPPNTIRMRVQYVEVN